MSVSCIKASSCRSFIYVLENIHKKILPKYVGTALLLVDEFDISNIKNYFYINFVKSIDFSIIFIISTTTRATFIFRKCAKEQES